MENNSETKLAKLLKNLSNYLLGATILCYLSGFAITNLYLGSLGVVNLDILRSRYILTGILFIIFISAILYLLYGIRKIIRENKNESRLTVLQKVFSFSFTNIFLLYVVVPVIAIFAGSANRISPILPQASSEISWSQWFRTESIKNVQYTIIALFAILITIVLVFLIVGLIFLIFNPKDKDGTRTSRRQKIGMLFTTIPKIFGSNYQKLFVNFIVVILVTYAVVSLSSILQLLRPEEVTSNISRESYFQVGWSRFFFGIVVVYAFIATLILMFSLPRNLANKDDENKKNEEINKDIIGGNFTWIYVFTPLVATMVSVYAFGIYPYLPQQIGGGRLIPVSVTSSSADMDAIFTAQTNETYIIDRAPNNSLFLIVDQPTDKYQILEVSNDLIESIVFYKSP